MVGCIAVVVFTMELVLGMVTVMEMYFYRRGDGDVYIKLNKVEFCYDK